MEEKIRQINRLWILDTDKGIKRVYANSAQEADARAGRKGLQVYSIRLATSQDFPENMNRHFPSILQSAEDERRQQRNAQ